MILTAAWLVPLFGALALPFLRWHAFSARLFASAVAALSLLALILAWARFDTEGPQFQHITEVPWVPSIGIAYRVGVDGISLAVATMSALLFLVAIAYPVETRGQPRQYYSWLLFLQSASLGVFLSMDLLLFYVFFDLTLVGMFFIIGRWGHGQPQLAALKFFLYTFSGSLVLLLGIIALYLSMDQPSFDMRILISRQPLAGAGEAGLVFGALMLGLAIKTPLVPFHTWLPQAHVDAPGPGSAILAGVLLKLGTYGMIRIPFSMMRETFATYAPIVATLALVAILYGALVALGQSNLKRRIAYTSVTHMGYTVLGIAVAASWPNEGARQLALTGATVEMVAHGLITGALFLVTGSFWRRTEDYEMDHYGGLARQAPLLAGFTILLAFASMGLPGLAGFVAEFQVFAGTLAVYPWIAVVGVLGILITAALFLDLLRRVFFGPHAARHEAFSELDHEEILALAILSFGVILIGVYPAFLLELVEGTVDLLLGVPGNADQ